MPCSSKQPTEIWEHRSNDAVKNVDGGWHVIVPLFTAAGSPSDLFAELRVDPMGNATLLDVHVD